MSSDQPASASDPMRLKLILIAVAAVVSAIAILVWLTHDDTDVATTDPTTTTTATVTSTSLPDSTTSPTVPSTLRPEPDTYATAVWPWPDSSQRFTDPVEAARSFAVDFVGFTDPIMGAFRQGDSRSGEVEVRPEAIGPVSTVFVRQLGADDTWWVLGSATANIEVNQPSALDAISAPVTLSGRANAFEGNVNVTVRVDGQDRAVAEGFVTGMMGDMGPFESAQDFPNPQTGAGALVFRTLSAKDGSVWEAGVIRVRFSPQR